MNLRQVKLKAKELLTFYHQCHNAKLDHKKLENEEFKMCIRGYHQSQVMNRYSTIALVCSPSIDNALGHWQLCR
ncbi:unnamed protein product [Fusarium graminearum]|nr:unnamed protein product [Fusarium graminearum]